MRKLKNKWVTKEISDRLYALPVPIVGLTGGIGTGKSTVANLFRKAGIPVIDADGLVKNVYRRNESLEFVKNHFPLAVNEAGIDFKILRQEAFKSAQNQALIEQYIYQQLPGEFKSAFDNFDSPAFIVYDVPLLFEKHLNEKVDVTLCTYSPRAIQLSRIIARDQISEELAQNILSKQIDIETKKASSDLVIENISDFLTLELEFEKVLNQLSDI